MGQVLEAIRESFSFSVIAGAAAATWGARAAPASPAVLKKSRRWSKDMGVSFPEMIRQGRRGLAIKRGATENAEGTRRSNEFPPRALRVLRCSALRGMLYCSGTSK